MDAPSSNIHDEIASLTQQIEEEKSKIIEAERVVGQYASPKPEETHRKIQSELQLSTSRKKIHPLEKRLKNLELIRDEEPEGWAVVFAQAQNDHDEIWKYREPGPYFKNGNRLPEHRVLELLMVADGGGDSDISSLSKIAFTLNQLHAMVKLHKTRSANARDQKKVYLQNTIEHHYGPILERYAKGLRTCLEFENVCSFLSEGEIYVQGTNELPPRTDRLSIHIHSVEGIVSSSSAEISIQSDPRWNSRWTNRLKCRINSHTGQPQKKDEGLFDYGLVDAYSIIELLVYKTTTATEQEEGEKAENSSIICGGLFIRALDIINYITHNNDSRTTDGNEIDAWFEIAPAGKMHLTIKFFETSGEKLEPVNLARWMPKPQRHLSQPMEVEKRYLNAGHQFVVKLFDNQVRCAHYAVSTCAFSLAAQCSTCKILCHTRCLEKGSSHFAWIPSCLNIPPSPLLSKKNNEGLPIYESKSHRWVPFLNLSATAGANCWCCHCGFPLSLGQGNHQEGPNRRCEACAKTCHAQ